MLEKTEIDQILKTIEELARLMLSTPEDERIVLYRKVDPCFLRLEHELRSSPIARASERIEEIKTDLIAIARLDDPDGHSDQQHFAWALEAICDLRGPCCFGIKRISE